ncbi:MAG: EAL domain-containing protein [Desulfuromonadaceae bacterium]|nr:EAL domain-containing protein [Desulfuromonadaceae bacterium]MDD2847542.1 EAL domain-containing protein [Desulfuromonadaceae bacterium]MDD4132222.1 EAL domain-containing protein [Desulfuromonadaceae bacterium]
MASPADNLVLLTIDDEESLRSSVAAFFEDCGFTVLQACDGRDGLEKIRVYGPDVVITDLRMPNVDGLEVVDAVRLLDDNLPIIVLSGTGVLSDALEALRRGAWDYLPKPLADLVELELVVARCLERSLLVRENRNYHENLELLIKERTVELRKLSTAVEQSANSVVITDANGVIEYVNPKFTAVSGYSREEAIGRNPSILNSGKQPDSYYVDLWETISSGREWRGEICNSAKDGRRYWELSSIAPIKDESGTITSYVAIKEDISGRKQHEEQLYYQANFDALTGLPNRYYFQKHLELQLGLINRESQYLMLMVLDIDNLKCVNDIFGHKFGDILIKEIARRLESVCGHNCVVSRFVGDEFTVIPPLVTEPDEARQRAELIRRAMNDVFIVRGTEIMATASIGVVVYPEDGECVESLLKNGEAAMYHAKKMGKNAICFYTRELNSQQEERFALEAKLHKALDRGEFTLDYQPQIDHVTGAVVGAEALLRWTPAGEAPVSPAIFIPILEESGMIVAVGEWVLWQACSQAAAWHKLGLSQLHMSVNISALQFMRSDLDVTVKGVLESTGLNPHCLCLELTESMVMVDSARTLEKMTALSALGVILSLDDFGTGYSSLEYLGRLPINELKIDMSFVQRMLTTKNDAAVVSTIIAMGHGLGMTLVAEGVETEEQLRYLAERECAIIQGFYFSRPLRPDQFLTFCQER